MPKYIIINLKELMTQLKATSNKYKHTHRSCSAKSNSNHTLRSLCDKNTLIKVITLTCFSSLSNCRKELIITSV